MHILKNLKDYHYFTLYRIKKVRDKLQQKSDQCTRIKEENSDLEDEIKQLKESHQ